MLDGDRNVAGLWCSEVLARLGDLLDGGLSEPDASRVRAHIGSCSVCARFGADIAQLLATLRADLSVPEAIDPGMIVRLRARIANALGTARG